MGKIWKNLERFGRTSSDLKRDKNNVKESEGNLKKLKEIERFGKNQKGYKGNWGNLKEFGGNYKKLGESRIMWGNLR